MTSPKSSRGAGHGCLRGVDLAFLILTVAAATVIQACGSSSSSACVSDAALFRLAPQPVGGSSEFLRTLCPQRSAEVDGCLVHRFGVVTPASTAEPEVASPMAPQIIQIALGNGPSNCPESFHAEIVIGENRYDLTGTRIEFVDGNALVAEGEYVALASEGGDGGVFTFVMNPELSGGLR